LNLKNMWVVRYEQGNDNDVGIKLIIGFFLKNIIIGFLVGILLEFIIIT